MKLPADGKRIGIDAGNRYFPFVYYQKIKDLRTKATKGERRFETQIHKTRDGLAFLELSAVLQKERLNFGGIIFNHPAKVKEHLREREQLETRPILREEKFHLSKRDVLLIATRPPLSDTASGVKRIVDQSLSPLETLVFAELKAFFETCNRAEIVLSDNWFPYCSDDRAEKYRAINFHQKQGARVKYLDAIHNSDEPPDDKQLSVGYLLAVPPGGALPCRIIAAFGMGGTETLWFCHLLRIFSAEPHIKAAWPRNLFRKALYSPRKCLWTIPFLVPDYAPTALACNPHDLLPNKECGGVIEWKLKK